MKHWQLRAIDLVKYILNLQLSPTGRTSLLKTFWSELKFLRTFNSNILQLQTVRVKRQYHKPLSESLGSHGPPLFTFKTERLDFRGLDRG